MFNNVKHNLKWPYIPVHPYRILIIGLEKIYLYAKDLHEPKYQLLIKKS